MDSNYGLNLNVPNFQNRYNNNNNNNNNFYKYDNLSIPIGFNSNDISVKSNDDWGKGNLKINRNINCCDKELFTKKWSRELRKSDIRYRTIDLNKEQICAQNACLITQPCYDPKNQYENRLYPYRLPRKSKQKTWLQLNVYGSAFAAAWKQILIIYIIDVLISLLIVNEIIPPSIFPFDGFIFGLVFGIYSFLIGVYFSIAFGNREKALVSYIIEIMGNTIDTGINMSSLAADKSGNLGMWAYQYDSTNMMVSIKKSSVWCHFKDVNYVLKSIPYAIKHKFRPGFGLVPERLPMPIELIEELLYRIKNGMDGLDALRDMYVRRIGRLVEVGILPASTSSNLLNKSDNYGTSIGKIGYLLGQAAIPPIFYNLIIISLWLYCIYLTFAIWPFWGLRLSLYTYYIALFLTITFLLGLFSAINNVNNPFQDPEESNFIHLDIGAIANETTETVDGLFEVVKNEIYAMSTSNLDNLGETFRSNVQTVEQDDD
jgi:hypothetical protein